VIRQNKRNKIKEKVLNITSKEKNLQICCTKLIRIVQNKQVFENYR